MHESELIIHTATQPFFCCCYYHKTLMLAATNEAVQLWDFLQGRMLGAMQLGHEVAPIAINKVKSQGQCDWFILQDKNGVILIFTCSGPSSNLKLQCSYQIDMIGFAKLPLKHYFLQESKPISYEIKDTFHTVSYPNKIESRQLLSGKVEKSRELQDVTLADITYMLATTLDGEEYLIVAEEGATITKIWLSPGIEQAKVHDKITVSCDQQIKIILWIEPISTNKALAVLREYKMAVISLSGFAVERFIDFRIARIIKNINFQGGQWAMAGKKCIGLLKNQKLVKKQNIYTNLIMDMDICKYGMVGVSQEGKLFFLSLSEYS